MSVTVSSLLFKSRTPVARGLTAFDVRVWRVGSDAENSGTSMDNSDYQSARHGDLIEAGTTIRGASFMNSKYNRKLVSPVTLPCQKPVIARALHALGSPVHSRGVEIAERSSSSRQTIEIQFNPFNNNGYKWLNLKYIV